MSQDADPQEPFRAIAEKSATKVIDHLFTSAFGSPLHEIWCGKRLEMISSLADEAERLIRLTVDATQPNLFDLCKCGHHHVGAEICISCDCDEQRKYTMDEYLAEIASRLAELLNKEQT